MSDVMMKALQIQVESLTRQIETLGPENERVRKLLTEFDQRHDADQARIRELEAELAASAALLKAERVKALKEAAEFVRKSIPTVGPDGPLSKEHEAVYHETANIYLAILALIEKETGQ